MRLPDQRELRLSDTVGFIDRLPHALVAAFRESTDYCGRAYAQGSAASAYGLSAFPFFTAVDAGGRLWAGAPAASGAGMINATAAVSATQDHAADVETRRHAAPEIDHLRDTATKLIVRAQRAGVMRPDFSVDDIPMLMAGLTTTMAAPGYDWRRHLEIILAGIRAAA